jgi:murein DD-endopeptidase MepM/ murein hydrolase activator NlpD
VPYLDTQGQWHGNSSRAFKASRDGRFHAGIDLYANAGDVLVAPEAGVVVGRQTFLNGTGAMLIQLDSGITVLLGETMMGGAEEVARRYNAQPVVVGSRVRAGQPVTVVGKTDNGSHMLHIETYTCCPTDNDPWYVGRPPPKLLRDPTDWLLRAQGAHPGD